MDIRANSLARAAALAYVMLLVTACSHMSPAVLGPTETAEMEASAVAAQGGNGFVCDGGTSTFTCFCKRGSTGNFSCRGMDRLCRASGTPMICKADGWCHCGGLYPKIR